MELKYHRQDSGFGLTALDAWRPCGAAGAGVGDEGEQGMENSGVCYVSYGQKEPLSSALSFGAEAGKHFLEKARY